MVEQFVFVSFFSIEYICLYSCDNPEFCQRFGGVTAARLNQSIVISGENIAILTDIINHQMVVC